MSDPFYAREKLGAAVRVLASHPGRIKDRLLEAVIAGGDGLSYFPPSDRPDLAWKLAWINDQLTVRAALSREGTYAASVSAMSEDQAVEVAKAIISVEWELGDLAARSLAVLQ